MGTPSTVFVASPRSKKPPCHTPAQLTTASPNMSMVQTFKTLVNHQRCNNSLHIYDTSLTPRGIASGSFALAPSVRRQRVQTAPSRCRGGRLSVLRLSAHECRQLSHQQKQLVAKAFGLPRKAACRSCRT